ncbi:ABC transporter substrate-binding protein [uncultured Sutterella sp.]|uniref:ABC transporter substrate-binding protein n=1 Tax=uncultured Sutterella sp. TaxID=286133 RepID=UPI0026145644|nr:ABC transporter substrate-binding protein [uncultured Sutterella sp.]
MNLAMLRGRHRLNQRTYLDAKLRVADHELTDHGDRVLMSQGITGRYPFLDRDVLDFSARIPPELLIYDEREKYPVRAMGEKYVPGRIEARAPARFRRVDNFYMTKRRLLETFAAAAAASGMAMADAPTEHLGSVSGFLTSPGEREALRRQRVFNVALLVNETGLDAVAGRRHAAMALFAAEEINAAGGVLGRRMVVNVLDCESDMEMTRIAMDSIQKVSESFVAIIGAGTSEQAMHCIPRADGAGIPYISTKAKRPGLCFAPDGSIRPWIFRLNLDAGSLGAACGLMTAQKGGRRVAALIEEGNVEEQAVSNGFRNSFDADGDLEYREIVYPRGTMSLWAYFAMAEAYGTDTILFPARGDRQSIGILQFCDREMKCDLIVWDEYREEPYWKDDREMLRRVFSFSAFNRADEGVPGWLEKARAAAGRYGVPITSDQQSYALLDASHSYMAVKLLADSLGRADSFRPERIRSAIQSATDLYWAGRTPLTIGILHEPTENSAYFYHGNASNSELPMGSVAVDVPDSV